MKLAGVLPVLMAIPVFAQSAAQSSTQRGTRIAQVQTVPLGDGPVSTGMIVSGSARFGDIPAGARLAGPAPKAEFETWVEQPSRDYAESVVTGFTGIERQPGKAAIHRFVRDNFRNAYLTYTMVLEAVPGTETFRVSFSDAAFPYPVPQILRDGETVALTLAADPRIGRRMVDYVRVGTGTLRPRQEVARDVYAVDAELTITQPRLRINGVEQQAASLPAVSAPVVWVYIPGHGRFELSFKPRAAEGFERAGEVSENSLVLLSGGNIFRIDCADRIATGSGTYNIYARKEPSESSTDSTRFMTGRGK